MASLRVLAFLLFSGVSSRGSSDCTYYGLLEHLNLTTSNAALEMTRPVKNWNTATEVNLDMALYGILGIDEKSQTVTSHIWFTMSWTNELLNWESSDFCGIDEVSVPRSRLWTPDVIIEQDASDSGSLYQGPWLALLSNGSTTSFARQTLTFTCRLDLYQFPFDIQHCNITFLSIGTDVNSLLLRSGKDNSSLMVQSEQQMATQGEWALRNMNFVQGEFMYREGRLSKLVYIVTLERKPFLYIVNFIIPLVYLVVLDLASFFIPVHSGEKFGFKVTVLLSISVLLLILKDILPSTEVDMPIIANLSIAVFTLVWLSLLETMLVTFLFSLDDCGDKECTEVKVRVRKESKEADGENGQGKPGQSLFPLGQVGNADVLKRILDEVKATRREAGSQRRPGCCSRAAALIDKFFFAGYFLTFVAFLTYICVGWIEF